MVDDAAENAYVRALVQGLAWIGGDDLTAEQAFGWLDGTIGYTNWSTGEPNDIGNEDCLVMYADGTWNDQSCEITSPVVCECDPF